jgi:hypothetical protein
MAVLVTVIYVFDFAELVGVGGGGKPAQYRLARGVRKNLSYCVPAGGARMRKIWTVVIAISLGLAVGACSKCEIPDLLPKMCKTGAGTNGM